MSTGVAEVDDVVSDIASRLLEVLRQELVGVYLFGSAASGAFTAGVSDVDLLAVIAEPPTDELLARLQRMHDELGTSRPDWKDRIEVAYLSRSALATFRQRPSRIGIISPGEPFHAVDAGRDWLMNWHDVRENGMVVLGPDPKSIIDPISVSELVRCILDYAEVFPGRVAGNPHRPSLAYAVVTMCRCLHTTATGEQASKQRAADWAAARHPQWADLIARSLEWRSKPADPTEATRSDQADVEAFVGFSLALLRAEEPQT